MDVSPTVGLIESNCAAVLAEHENSPCKRKRGRPKKKGVPHNDIRRTISTPLAVGRKTRMSVKVAECLESCKENIAELIRKKKQLEQEIAENEAEIAREQLKAAQSSVAASLRVIDSLNTKRADEARRKFVKGQRRRKKVRKTRVPYTRRQLREALESLVEGHKSVHPTKAEAKVATSVRRAARLFMDNKYSTLQRIVQKHDFVAKIQSMSRYIIYICINRYIGVYIHVSLVYA